MHTRLVIWFREHGRCRSDLATISRDLAPPLTLYMPELPLPLWSDGPAVTIFQSW